jgi:DNA-binding NtrC family response regulator
MSLRATDRPHERTMSENSTMAEMVAAFHQVAAGVEGTHRMLMQRVEELTRELESLRGEPATSGVPVCDGAVTLETIERQVVVATLERFAGHRDRTAKALGIGVRTLGMKLRQWKDAGLVPSNL